MKKLANIGFRYFMVALLCILGHHDLSAQKIIQYDSSSADVRHFTESRIRSYRDQREFDYTVKEAGALSLWDRFWAWFWAQFFRISQKKSIQRGFEIFIWLSSISLILFAIYRITGMEKRFFLKGGGNGRPLRYNEGQEDIHSIDFNRDIEEAIHQQQYRVAIRLMYLRSLKLLSDKNLIDFKPNKTNFDYTGELADTDFARGFSGITMVYEYAWYGEFPIDEEIFARLRVYFSDYFKIIGA
jgi:Domain of unknown function (DUF4129)